jgi:hypothetical protein
MLKLLIPKVNAWIRRSVYRPGDSDDFFLLKRIHWALLNLSVILVSPIIPLALILNVPNWLPMGITYVGFSFIQLIIFYRVYRGIEVLGKITQLFHVTISFVGVLITGGILHSAGMFFIGLIGPLYVDLLFCYHTG